MYTVFIARRSLTTPYNSKRAKQKRRPPLFIGCRRIGLHTRDQKQNLEKKDTGGRDLIGFSLAPRPSRDHNHKERSRKRDLARRVPARERVRPPGCEFHRKTPTSCIGTRLRGWLYSALAGIAT